MPDPAMSAGPITVYRSADPTAVGAFDRARADAEAFEAALDRFFEYHPEVSYDQLRVRSSGERTRIVGFKPTAAQETRRAPKGWRRESYGLFMPSVKTADGCRIQMELDALPPAYTIRHYLEADAGMPSAHLAGDPFRGARLLSPAVALRGERVWVRWNCDTAALEPDLPSHWERVPLSAYYALVESGRDPFVSVTPVDEAAP